MRILVTGGSGFIGAPLGDYLSACGHKVRLAVRNTNNKINDIKHSIHICGEINSQTDWTQALTDIDAVIHLAAAAHKRAPTARVLDEVNVGGSVNLYRQMRDKGVRRMVYLSTIKVNGEHTGDRAFTCGDTPEPQTEYAKSKYRAECALRAESETVDSPAKNPAKNPELAIVRCPLVYGPGVKGNLRHLLNAIWRGIPLPLASISNKRSLVSLKNLHSFLERCVVYPDIGKTLYMVCDNEDISTPGLAIEIGRALQLKTRLMPCPVGVLRAAGVLLGRTDAINRLCHNLQVDMSESMDALKWRPPQTLRAGLRDMAHVLITER